VKQVHVGDWLRIRFTGQIVEVVEVVGNSAIVLRADGRHDPFSIYPCNLLPLGGPTWRAMNTLFADAMLATFRARA
jgi:hypothetical protein